jgi:hypothetical protein
MWRRSCSLSEVECIRKSHGNDPMYILSMGFGGDVVCRRFGNIIKLRGLRVQTRTLYE